MKRYLLLGASLLCCQLLTAQHRQDVIYFKNGSVIRGHIFSTGGGNIRIENRVKDTLVFTSEEVLRIVQEKVRPKISEHGFYNINEAGMQFSDRKGLVLRCIAGYRFAYQWQVGAGIGLDDYQIRSAPVFADIRYDFSRDDRTFFVNGAAGISMPWPTDNQSGIYGRKQPEKKLPGVYVHGGVGYKFRWKNNDAFHFSAGYSYAAMKTKYAILDWQTGRDLGTYTTYNYTFSRVTVLIGFTF